MNNLNLVGTPREIGFQYGKYFAELGVNLSATLPPGTKERKEYSESVKFLYKSDYPAILKEIEGVAQGNGCDAEVLTQFLLSMYVYTAMNFCTCITGLDHRRHLLLGRNSDFLTAMQPMYSHCVIKPASGYAFTGNTTGFVEMEDGMNEKGLAVGLTFVYSAQKHFGLNAGMIVRILLEHCANVNEAITRLKKMKIGSSQILTMADSTGNKAVVECSAQHIEIIQSHSILYSVNQFVSDAMRPYNPENIDDMESGLRLKTCQKAFQHQNVLSMEYLKEVLKGKQGFLCQYDRRRGGDTVWSVIYDLNDDKIQFCDGNPSREGYQTIKTGL